MLQEVTLKMGKMAFAAMFAIGLSSSCAYAQTATFTAVVAQVNTAAGTISLTQTLRVKPTALGDSPTATADYQAATALLNNATVGATVQATVERINGNPAVIILRTPAGVFSGTPAIVPATASSAPALTSALASSVASNPARLTPAGIQ